MRRCNHNKREHADVTETVSGVETFGNRVRSVGVVGRGRRESQGTFSVTSTEKGKLQIQHHSHVLMKLPLNAAARGPQGAGQGGRFATPRGVCSCSAGHSWAPWFWGFWVRLRSDPGSFNSSVTLSLSRISLQKNFRFPAGDPVLVQTPYESSGVIH